MSAKRTPWNEFSFSMASAVTCLSTGRKFNFSKYIFESLVRNVDSFTKFYMYPRFLQLMIRAQVVDLSSHSTKYSSHVLTQKVFTNMRRVGKGFSGVDAPLFEDKDVTLKDVAAVAKDVAAVEKDARIEENADVQRRQAESQAQIYQIDLEHADKVLSIPDNELEPTKLKKVVEVVTTAKLMTEVVIAASATITAADTPISVATVTAAPSAARRRKGVVIRDHEEIATPSIVIHCEAKSKDKRKGILVEKPKPLKKQAQIEQDEAYARELEAKLNKNINWDEVIEKVQRNEKEENDVMRMSYNDIRPIFEKKFNSNVAFLEKTREQMEEKDNKALKRTSESQAEKAAKKQKLDEENNKPYYKIIRADRTRQLFLSFLSLLRNFDREDLEVLWELVKERFASSNPKNFSDDILLTTLTYMFEKPDVQAQVWKNQRTVHGLAMVKSWRLLESCGVHIITFTTTQMILLVEKRYPFTRFTLDQMFNNVRLEVEEESKVSLELLRFVRQQQQEGFRSEWCLDTSSKIKTKIKLVEQRRKLDV
nr:hypothetical protein [Tanacetum cinerariifolium]